MALQNLFVPVNNATEVTTGLENTISGMNGPEPERVFPTGS